MAKVKKWHVASAVAIVAILILIVVLVSRRGGSRLSTCPAVPMGDPLTSYTQDSNCAINCTTTDTNATVTPDVTGACRSKCKPGFIKGTLSGQCTVSLQTAQVTIDNLKIQLMDVTDPKMQQQINNQIAAMQKEVDQARQTAPQIQTAPTVQAQSQIQTAPTVQAQPQIQTAPTVQAQPQIQTAPQTSSQSMTR